MDTILQSVQTDQEIGISLNRPLYRLERVMGQCDEEELEMVSGVLSWDFAQIHHTFNQDAPITDKFLSLRIKFLLGDKNTSSEGIQPSKSGRLPDTRCLDNAIVDEVIRWIEPFSDLGLIKEDAEEEGFVEPEAVAIENARSVLHEVCCRGADLEYNVYSMADGSVSIETPSGKGSSASFMCKPDGRVVFLLNIKGKPFERITYPTLTKFRCDFVFSGLRELQEIIGGFFVLC